MANTCFTDVFIHDKPDALLQLQKIMQKAADDTYYEKGWLGNLLIHLGHPFMKVMDGEFGQCAGTIHDITIDDGDLIIGLTSNWEPQLIAIREFVKAYAPNAMLDFVSVEPIERLCVTSLPNMVNLSLDDELDVHSRFLEDWEHAWNKDELCAAICQKLGIQANYNTAIGMFLSSYPTISLDDFVIASVDDYCRTTL